MKRLSNIIKESIWADIHKRSNGEQVRKEDDVNHMDPNQLYDYVTKYNDKVQFINFMEGKNSSSISVEIILGLEVSINYYNDKIYNILIDVLKNVTFNDNAVSDKFDIKKINNSTYRITEKNGDVSNYTFVKLIDFFLNNMDGQELTSVEESVWADIHKRSNGSAIRKEDEISNLHTLKPIDIGGDVLWADKDLEYDGNTHILFDDIPGLIQNSEWRLPTIKDIDDLNRHCSIDYLDRNYFYLNSSKSLKLTFKKKGMIYNTAVTHGNEYPTYLTEYWGWTSEDFKNGIHCFIITGNHIMYTHSNQDICTDRHAKLCVRLVKDK